MIYSLYICFITLINVYLDKNAGLFDFSAEPEFIGKEIVKCIDMAKDGIHAVLVVLSVRSRFSREEEAAVQSLRKFFGSKISDYMIVVFTGGDDLEENDETLEDYLGRACPEPLKVGRNYCLSSVLCNALNRLIILNFLSSQTLVNKLGKQSKLPRNLLFYEALVLKCGPISVKTDKFNANIKEICMNLTIFTQRTLCIPSI